jgi:hypothetical protein
MSRKIARILRDLWIYFKAGHGGYLVYSMSIMNFVVLQHRLLIQSVPFLSKYLGKLSSFIIFFFLTYIPLAIVLGHFEFRKGELTRRPMLNPYIQDSIESTLLLNSGLLDYINGDADGAREKIEESLNIMNRWRKKR